MTSDSVSSVRKNVLLLAACQALFMTGTSAIITTAPHIGGVLLAENKALVTLPLCLQFVAMAITTIPASLYMGRVGRRVGFITGSLVGAVGAGIGAYSVISGSFALFCVSAMLTGSFNGFSHYFRFAAADASPLEFRSRAISYVLAGSVVAAFLGPTLARHTFDLLPVQYAGVYLALILVYLLVGCVASFLDIPRPTIASRRSGGRPLVEIARQPKFIVAVCAATFGYLVMSFLMTVTPIAMGVCGFSFSDSSYVIQGHVLGMYVPAFFTGTLIARYGVNNILVAGALILALCVGIDLAGVEFLNFMVALVLLGVGWNFLFTGGTALLTETYTSEEKAKVEGLNDFFIWGLISVGVFVSGAVQNALGWTAVNLVMAPIVLLILAGTLWLRFGAGRRDAQRSAA